jgi:uncharacterized membrane protein HdeD (DUF308 family)
MFVVDLNDLRRNWGWFLATGIALIVMGILALGASVVTTFVSVLFVGWLLVAEGILQTVLSFRVRSWGGFFLYMLSGVLSLIAGLLIVTRPLAGALALTLLMAAFLLAGGALRVAGSVVIRFPGWGWALLGGIIDLVLGALIWAEWPASALWVIGMFLGIYLVFRGWSFVMFALALRTLSEPEAADADDIPKTEAIRVL